MNSDCSVYKNDYTDVYAAVDSKYSAYKKEDYDNFKNLDKQLLNMINYAKLFIQKKGIIVNDKVILNGYSATSHFVNHFSALHPEVVRDGQTLKEEVEIGTGLLDEYRGKHLGTLLEKELSKKLLEMYPRFNEIVARIDNDNINSIKAATNAGFEHIKDDEYYFKR